MRLKMNRVSRAKQFLPFDALAGFQEALREKEIEKEDRKDLAEDKCAELEQELNKIENGDKIKIKYYRNGKYIELTGIITNIDYNKKKIQINKDANINVCDIMEIKHL